MLEKVEKAERILSIHRREFEISYGNFMSRQICFRADESFICYAPFVFKRAKVLLTLECISCLIVMLFDLL